jgi:hypothetical protein
MEPARHEIPIACDLGAIATQDRSRHAALLDSLRTRTRERRELSDGYAFRFDADTSTLTNLAAWVGLERLCCPFLRFTIEVEPGGSLWLRLTGSADVKTFVGETFAAP